MGLFNEIYKLEKIGCTDIERYTLVNNYGYRFSIGGVKCDLRYWENCYGVYGGGWSVIVIDAPGSSPTFGDNFDGVIEWIENNLQQKATTEDPKTKYPCTECGRVQPCSYRECSLWRAWFTREWKAIQKVANEVKERKQ